MHLGIHIGELVLLEQNTGELAEAAGVVVPSSSLPNMSCAEIVRGRHTKS
jgi:hypothetical protein